MADWDSEEFPVKDRTLRYPVWEAIGCNFVVILIAAFVLPSMLGGDYHRAITARSDLRDLSIPIEDQFNSDGVYPPGHAFAGNIDDVPTVWQALGMQHRPPNFVASNIREEGGAVVQYAFFALLAAWLVCIPGMKRLFPHIMQGISCVILLPCAFGPGHILFAIVPLALGSLIGLPAAISGRSAGKSESSRLPASERRLAVFMPLALAIFLTGWFLQAQQIKQASVEERTKSYRYVTDGATDWLLQSTGPDAEYGLDFNNWPAKSSTETDAERWLRFIEVARTGKHTYDPSNGTTSNGDIFRFSYPEEGR